MTELSVEDRVTHLEGLMAQLLTTVDRVDRQLDRTDRQIGAIASLYVAAELVHYGERLGLIVLGFGEDVMEVLNSPEFTPKAF